jgi:restriction endonuclease S subunit
VEDEPSAELYLSDKTLRMDVDETRMNPRFLMHALASRLVREQIELEAEGSSGQKNVSHEDLRNLLVPILPLHRQNELAEVLDALVDHELVLRSESDAASAARIALVEKLIDAG